jgi:hypothetical protein
MKTFFSLLSFLILYSGTAQNRNLTVKSLNNYVLYSNANISALWPLQRSLERYNDLFNEYLSKNSQLGGEKYEKPKPSPFIDEDVFTLKTDDPETLYFIAMKESANLPASARTDFNNSMKEMRASGKKLEELLVSLSDIFSGPLIQVTKNEAMPPYSLLAEAKKQLQLSKTYRDKLFKSLTVYYKTNCSLNASSTDYIRSVEELSKGMQLCQNMMSDLSKNDPSKIPSYVKSLDSLYIVLERSELTLLKGVKPFGNSKHFPNPNYFNGFDLYTRYENIINWFQVYAGYGKRFINISEDVKIPNGKCYYYHSEWSSTFNSNGLLDEFNEYVLLIGGGKMKIESEVGTLWKGWGDEKNSLLLRNRLFWMKETPGFEIEY